MNNHEKFFKEISQKFKNKHKVKLILVTHLLPDRPIFLKYLSKTIDIVTIIPKLKSINKEVENSLCDKYNILKVHKSKFKDSKFVLELIKRVAKNDEFIISDIGGYFSNTINDISKEFNKNFLGIIEDTENGFQKYLRYKNLPPCPIFSVARSSLKYPEDILIGYSTVFSAESVLRQKNEILTGKQVTVIGYGKIGEHVVRDLMAKKAIVSVYDISKIKMTHALAEGHQVISKQKALKNSDIIFSVTGNKSLSLLDFKKIKSECYIFSITSSDDEFYLEKNFKGFKKEKFSPAGITLINGNSKIHLVNHGNAVNFLHGAVVGNFIFLVQAEIIYCINELISKKYNNDFLELNYKKKEEIASTWLKYFK